MCNISQNENSESIIIEDNTIKNIKYIQIDYLIKKLKYTASRCKLGFRTECQHLINLCVLQDYNIIDQNACSLAEDIQKNIFNKLGLNF